MVQERNRYREKNLPALVWMDGGGGGKEMGKVLGLWLGWDAGVADGSPRREIQGRSCFWATLHALLWTSYAMAGVPPPTNSSVGVLIPRTSEHNPVWRRGCDRDNHINVKPLGWALMP